MFIVCTINIFILKWKLNTCKKNIKKLSTRSLIPGFDEIQTRASQKLLPRNLATKLPRYMLGARQISRTTFFVTGNESGLMRYKQSDLVSVDPL